MVVVLVVALVMHSCSLMVVREGRPELLWCWLRAAVDLSERVCAGFALAVSYEGVLRNP